VLHPAFQFTPDDIQEITFDGNRNLALGVMQNRFLEQDHYYIVLAETTAEIFLVPFSDNVVRQSVQFMISSIMTLLLYLRTRLTYSPQMRELGDREEYYRSEQARQSIAQEERLQRLHTILDKQREVAETVRKEFLRIDAKAIDVNLDSFWNEVLAI
jgi:hypothetical protein